MGRAKLPDRALEPAYPIVTPRLLVRPFRPDDLGDSLEIHALPEVVRYLYWGIRQRREAEHVLRRRIAMTVLRQEGDGLALAVELRDTGRLIGEVSLTWVSRQHRSGEIGFVLHPAHQRRGYAGEAATEMLRLGFDDLGLHRIVGRCDARNTASAALMARLGMRREGHFVENEWVKGEWTDELVYAILDREWRDRNERRPSAPAP